VLPVVAVQVAPAPPADQRELAALLSACSTALPAGACELKRPAAQDPSVTAQAQVTWDERGNALVVVQLDTSSHQLTRDLVFSPRDPELQRWRTAGLTIATMVDELRIEREEQSTPASPPPPTPAAETGAETPAAPPEPLPTAAPQPPREHPKPQHRAVEAPRFPSRNALETGGLLALGLDGATPRGGLYAGGLHDMSRLPALALVRVAYQVSSRDQPSLSWFELGLGGGAYLSLSSFRVEALGALEVVRIMASARAPTSSAVDDAAAWLPAAIVVARGVWPARGAVSGSLGLSGQWIARRVVVTNAGQEAARSSAYSVGLVGGIRFVL
jgi:hypothetical protein